jgi:hypothetical protein
VTPGLRQAVEAPCSCPCAAHPEGGCSCGCDCLDIAEKAALRSALRAVEAHHAAMCDAAGRPQTNSNTLRIVRAGLAGCSHLPGDVCRVCHPSLPLCARHLDAPRRRFGPLWRCSVCGEPGSLLAVASALEATSATPEQP